MITGMPRIAIAANEFDKLVATFREKFGVPVIDMSETSVDSLGADLSKAFANSIQSYLETRGEGMYALVLQTPDLDDTVSVLSERGLNPSRVSQDAIEVSPAQAFGARIRIESAGADYG